MQVSSTICSSYGTMEVLFLAVLLYLLFRTMSVQFRDGKSCSKSESLPIPSVSKWLPFIGHLVQMTRDPLTFVDNCYKRFGKVFTIRLGSTKMTFMCDRDLLNEFYSADESKLSFFKFIEATYFNRAFSDTLNNPIIILKPFIKQAFITRLSKFLDSTNDELKFAINEFKNSVGAGSNLHDIDNIMHVTYMRAVFKSMFAFEMTPEIGSAFEKFTTSVTVLGMASNVFHPTIIKQMFLRHTRACRNEYIRHLLPHVENYWANAEKQESAFIRTAVDYTFAEIGNGRKLLPQEVCQFLLSIHFTMASSPIPMCYQVLKELTRRPDLWRQIREELKSASDLSQISKNKTLHACIMEGIRLNANMLVLFRKTNKHSQLGNYYLGDTDIVGVPGALLFELEPGEEIFSEAGEYKPERFLRENKPDPMDSKSVWLWSSGVHACTGRNLSLNVMKMFIAHFVLAFDAEIVSSSKRNYFTMSPVALQKFKLKLTPITN